MKTRKIEFALLLAVLILAFVLRLYKISRPIGDWHSWRQADTAAVSRNFIKEGYNPFIPKYDDMSSQANALPNPNRYRFVEFPIYNTVIYGVWKITGINETYARLATVFITLGSTLLLFFIVRIFSGSIVALLSAFLFAAIPYNVFYSSAILPGPLMVFGILGLYLSFINWLKKDFKKSKTGYLLWGIASLFFANLAILTWPIASFFFLPVVYLAFEKYRLNAFRKIDLWIFALLSLAPFIAWRMWMINFPEGIPNWHFLTNQDNIRFRGAFFRWLVVERMGKLILTVGGLFLFILGVLKKPEKEKLFYLSWLAAAILYFIVFASGNVRHDYYQVPFIPIAAIFMALGTKMLFKLPESFNRLVGPPIAFACFASIFAFGFFEIKGFYWINRPEIISAGKAADRLLPKDASVIAPYGGDAAFLYQTNRPGYPIADKPLNVLVDQGTKYLVAVNLDDSGIQDLSKNCKVLEQSPQYLIIELSKECLEK